MKFEFIIRDVKTHDDLRYAHKVDEERFDYVKGLYEDELNRIKDLFPLYRSDFVLLINKLDDNGDFLEVVQ